MEIMPVTTKNTTCIEERSLHKIVVNLSGNRKEVYWQSKNNIKSRDKG